VGIALSARSAWRDEAADLARTIASPEIQKGMYVESGGQPGHSIAWDSGPANARVGGFFRDTRETIEQAFIRPRVPGHRLFQQEAGLLVHEYLWANRMDERECMDKFEQLFQEHLSDWRELEERRHVQQD
jgi:multiple sugar transport system substrate-binding protein